MDEAQKVEDENGEKQQARTDLKELLKIISTSSGHVQLDRYFNDRDIFIKESSITHNALWTLFPPGTLILARPFFDEPQVFSVQSCDEFTSDGKPFNLICYCFDWNGHEFNRVPFKMSIEPWGEDRKSIIELPFYPLSYYNEPDLGKTQEESIKKLKATLIERGKQYESYCTAERGKQMFNYEGAAYFQRGGIISRSGSRPNGEPDGVEDDSSSTSGSGSFRSYSGDTGRKQV